MRQGTRVTLNLIEMTALRDIHAGLAMFVSARQSDDLIARGFVGRRLDGRLFLTNKGLMCIGAERGGVERRG